MKNVYLVDDSDEVRKRLIDLISDLTRIRVVGQAGDAATALREIGQLRPDVVILDIRLPGGRSGLDILHEIKRSWPNTSIILMTNYDYPQYRQEGMIGGADFFFNKTREFERIVDVLEGLK